MGRPHTFHRASLMLPPVLARSSSIARALRILSESEPYSSTSPVPPPMTGEAKGRAEGEADK
eukprot:3851367-Rhodomonas_salina.3